MKSWRAAAGALVDPDFLERRREPLMAALFVAGTALLLLSAMTGRGGDLINGDARDHFEYARALFAEGRAPDPRVKYPCGVAMIGSLGYGPSIFIAAAVRPLGLFDSERARQGWGLLNQFAYCLPLLGFAWFATRLNFATLTRLGFGARISAAILPFWIAGTNIGYYFFKEPAMSEGATYSALSLYYWLLFTRFLPMGGDQIRVEGEGVVGGKAPAGLGRDVARACGVGLALGLAGIIRQPNILHCLAVPIVATAEARRRFAGDRGAAARWWIGVVGAAALASGAVFLVPYAAWAASPGGGVKAVSYTREGFDFLHPHLIAPLLSINHHGVFVWTPIFALAAAGMVLFARTRPLAAVALVPTLLLQHYLNASWWGFSFGAGFGNRGYFTVYPLLLPGLAALAERADRRGRLRGFLLALLALTLWNALLMLLLSAGILPANRVYGGER